MDNENKIRDVSSLIEDWEGIFLNQETLKKFINHNLNDLPLIKNDISIAPCVGKVGKFICVANGKESFSPLPFLYLFV